MNKKILPTIFLKKNRRDKMLKKGALEISFGWLFAIIAGAIIIFGAIYFSTKLIGTQQEVASTETGKEIGILLNPLETGFESSQTTSIAIPAETRIHNTCDEGGTFGRQFIQLDQKSFGKWVKTDTSVNFENKYIFSEDEIEGKKFYIFSKPFNFPFKVADLIYMTSALDVYCFVDAPDEIESEIEQLNQSNLLTGNCTEEKIRVCFNSNNCEINVDYFARSVEKGGDIVYFAESSDALMYAAIFSTEANYECQLKRLMSRTSEITKIYIEKESITKSKGCDDNLKAGLVEFQLMTAEFSGSEELELIQANADSIEQDNTARMCLLW